MNNSFAQIEKLNNLNYATWSVTMRSLLIAHDYWDVVEKTCPTSASAETRAAWARADQKALAMITLCVKPSELIHIKKCSTAMGAWHKLSDVYKSSRPARKVNIFKKLMRFRLKAGEKFAEQINDFFTLVDDIKDIGMEIPEDLLSILLLCSLPDEMDGFVVAMESRDSLPKVEQLKVKILDEEQRRGERKDISEESVFAVKAKKGESSAKFKPDYSEKRDFTANNKRNIRCYACGKRGHIRAECRSKGNAASALLSLANERISS